MRMLKTESKSKVAELQSLKEAIHAQKYKCTHVIHVNGARVCSILILKTLPSTSLLTLHILALCWCEHLWQHRVTVVTQCVSEWAVSVASMCKIRDEFDSAPTLDFQAMPFRSICSMPTKSLKVYLYQSFASLNFVYFLYVNTQTHIHILTVMQPIETYFHFSRM